MRQYAGLSVPGGPPPFAPPVSPAVDGFLARLGQLADACDELTGAVERHELAALVGATERAERLAADVGRLEGALDEADRRLLDGDRVRALGDRLSATARRNAFLIERAWALDAATMRLLLGIAGGQPAAADGTVPASGPAAYTHASRPAAWLDRQA